MVAFVETTYTVMEREGQVEVCVNLTQPSVDILDEIVRVELYNNQHSMSLSPNAVLASESHLYSYHFDLKRCFFFSS